MLAKVTHPGLHHPRRTALLALVFVLFAAVVGGSAATKLNAANAFENPGSQAAHARIQIERATGAEPSAGVIALVHGTPFSAAVSSVARTLRNDPGVAHVASYTKTHNPALIAKDGSSTLLAASLYARAAPDAVVARLTTDFAGRHDVQLGGADVTLVQTNLQAAKDLGFAELLAFPLLALLAFLIFRGVAALLPLGVGITSVLGSMLALRLINAALPLSSFALNVVVGLGLGLSIDYSLILVSRFREELGRGVTTTEAITTTFQTAGRTVIFSALTVAAATASLTVFPLRFLQSIGIGGAVVALSAAATSLLLLPALFVLLGSRLGKAKPVPSGYGVWYRLAHGVMRHPGSIATATITGLVLLAVPTLSTKWTGVDASVLPTTQMRVVVCIADRPDRSEHLTVIELLRVVKRRVLAPGVGMANELEVSAGLACTDRHPKRIQHQRSAHVRRQLPADDHAGEHVEHEAEVDDPLPAPQIREIPDPQAVRGVRGEVTFDQVPGADSVRIGFGGPPRLPAPFRANDPVRCHQPLHPAARDPLTSTVQRLPHPPVPVRRIVVLMHLPDHRQQPLVLHNPLRALASGAVIVGGRRYAQGPADRLDPETTPVLIDIAGHFDRSESSSRAKNRLADRRISFERRSSAFSLRNFLISSRSALLSPWRRPSSISA